MFGKGSKYDIEQHTSETPDTKKPTLFQRYKTHMKKWWWAHLLAFCCIVLVIILPLLYVGIPRFASEYINNYEYDYAGLDITNPTPNSFRVRQSKSLSMGGAFSGSGHLSAFNASIRRLGSDTTFAVFPVPEIDFSNGVEFDIDQQLQIDCVSCLSEIAVAAASDQEFTVLVTGDPYLKFGALPTAHLNIQKKMTMQGYNVQEFVNSPGAFNVTSVDFKQTPGADGYNVNATVAVHNPTPFAVDMGAVTFNLTIDNSPIGYVFLPNLTLEYNKENVTEMVVLGNIDVHTLTSAALWGDSGFGAVNIGIHGGEVVYNGQDIPFYTAAIKALNATVEVNLLQYASDF